MCSFHSLERGGGGHRIRDTKMTQVVDTQVWWTKPDLVFFLLLYSLQNLHFLFQITDTPEFEFTQLYLPWQSPLTPLRFLYSPRSGPV